MRSLQQGAMRTHTCGELTSDHVGSQATLCGWVDASRNLGGLWFLDLRDREGIVQVNFKAFQGDMDPVKRCHLESVVRVSGLVCPRPPEAVNRERATGADRATGPGFRGSLAL